LLQNLNDTVAVNDRNSCLYRVTSEVFKLRSAGLKKERKNPRHFYHGSKDSEAFIRR